MDDLDVILNIAKSDSVVFFSKDECPHCVSLENDLSSMSIPYKKVMLESDLREKLVEYTNHKTVPQLFIGGSFIGGYSEFVRLANSGSINRLLKPLGIVPVIDF